MTNNKESNTDIETILGRFGKLPANSPPPPASPTAAQIDTALEAARFPLRHRSQLLAGLHGPSLEAAETFLPRILDSDCLLFLCGILGPGKTQMATWWASQLIAVGKKGVCYRKTADLIGEIKQTWSDGGKSLGTEDDLLRRYRSVRYLVLDEFHERGSSEWEGRTLVNILDHRYDSMLSTVLIANLTEKQVREQISPSILSRAEETGGLVLCDWPSYRSQAL